MERKNFGIEVKKYLLAIGMKQSEIAEKIGVSESSLVKCLEEKDVLLI